MKNTIIKIGIVGCGFVSEYYMATLSNYKKLELVAATDLIQERAINFTSHFNVRLCENIEELLNIATIDIVLNLTDPENHFEVSKSILKAGKHLYSEKPLTLSVKNAQILQNLAVKNNVYLSGAPCSILGASAQTLKTVLNQNIIGKIQLIHIEMDDGPIHLMNPDQWKTELGVPWPYKNEFELGSSIEHLGYPLTWLIYLFGEIQTIKNSSFCIQPNKMENHDQFNGNDYSVAIMKHKNGIISRLTCGIIAPMNRSILIVGEKGTLEVKDIWDNNASIKWFENSSLKLKAARKNYITNFWLTRSLFGLNKKNIALIGKRKRKSLNNKKNIHMDYMLGVADLANSILENRAPVLNDKLILHVNEITLKINGELDTNIDNSTLKSHSRMVG